MRQRGRSRERSSTLVKNVHYNQKETGFENGVEKKEVKNPRSFDVSQARAKDPVEEKKDRTL